MITTFYTNQSIIYNVLLAENYVDYYLFEAEETADEEVNPLQELYFGRAYKLEGEGTDIDVTDIVLPLVTPASINNIHEGGDTVGYKTFILRIDDGHTNMDFPFRVWYYNVFDKDGETDIYTSKVIKGVVGESAPVIMTHTFPYWIDDDTETFTVTGLNGHDVVFSESQSVQTPTLIYFKNTPTGCSRIEYTYTQDYPIEFGVVPDCDRPTLYWQNQLGGISQILLNSTNHKEYTVERHQITKRIRKSEGAVSWLDRHGKSSYLNEGTLKWVLNTPLLSDSEMDEISDLMLSNKAWLWIGGKMYAVNVTDTNVKVKRFKEDKMFNLTINCEYAQTITTY